MSSCAELMLGRVGVLRDWVHGNEISIFVSCRVVANHLQDLCGILFSCTSSCAKHILSRVGVSGLRFKWIDYTIREVEPIIFETLWDSLLLHVVVCAEYMLS
jgi:hypothetical protein